MHGQDYIHPNKVRQVLLLAIIVLLAWVLWSELYFMFTGFLGAVALYVLLRKPMLYLVHKKKWKRWIAAVLLILLSLLVIIYPFAWIFNVLIEKLSPHISDNSGIQESLRQIDNYLHNRYGFDIFSMGNIEKVSTLATAAGGKIVSTTLHTLTNLLVTYFVLWFMLMKAGFIQPNLVKALPVKRQNADAVVKEMREMIMSNSIGIPVLGLVQGVVAMIGYSLFGVEEPVLWGIITGIASVVPIAGTMLAWVPLTILAFARGDSSNGIWLGLWGLFVIGGSDNVFRFILQKYLADIHPLVTVFGVVFGLNLFGFMGIIFGPLVLSLFFLLVRIYYDEFVHHPNHQ